MVAPSMKTRGTQDAVGGQKQRIEGNRVLKEGHVHSWGDTLLIPSMLLWCESRAACRP